MVLQRKMAQVQIHCAEPWVWLSTMMLSVVHQNSMWLMTMPNALLLVQYNVRYVKNIAFVNVVSSFLFYILFFSILQNILECSSFLFVVSPTFWPYGIYDVIRIMNVVLALQAGLFVLILILLSYQKAF